MTSWQKLSPREQEVARLLIDGKSNKEAAILLSISPRTVEVHRARIYEKIGAKNTAEFIRMMSVPEPVEAKTDRRIAIMRSMLLGLLVQVKSLAEQAQDAKVSIEALLMEMEGGCIVSKAGERMIEGMKEAVAIAKGEQPAARIHFNGHSYVPVEEYERAILAERERCEINSAQAYQVIGNLLSEVGKFESDEGIRALDYFSGDSVDEDFLPWTL